MTALLSHCRGPGGFDNYIEYPFGGTHTGPLCFLEAFYPNRPTMRLRWVRLLKINAQKCLYLKLSWVQGNLALIRLPISTTAVCQLFLGRGAFLSKLAGRGYHGMRFGGVFPNHPDNRLTQGRP